MAEYIIKSETLKAIADVIRAQTGSSDSLTVEQMIEKINTLPDDAFYGYISGAILGINDNTVESIRGYAFRGKDNIKTVSFPKLKTASSYAFAYCYANKIDLPEITEAGDSSFNRCYSIKELNYPLLKSIGDSCFEECRSVTKINLPSLETVGSSAFYNSISLIDEIELPSVKTIGNSSFSQCRFAKAKFPLATTVERNAFSRNSLLKEISLPLVTTISGDSVFQYCSGLETINLPLVTSIPSSTFYYCSKLSKADFSSATSIATSAFNRCSNLITLILRSETMCTLANTNAFTSTPIASGAGYIYVPKALVSTYKADSKWKTYKAQIRAIEDYPEICNVEEEVSA